MLPIPTYSTNHAATWSLVTGILGLVLMPIPLFIGFILGGGLAVIAVILGIIGLLNSRSREGKGTARAIWGLVLAAITFLGISVGGGIWW